MTGTSLALLSPRDRLGRYEILAEVAKGGMAVVYAARLRGMGGFDKILAVKRMLPHLVEEKEFVDMFLDEARIAAAIHHPNVVEIFELGEEAEVPFIVMEYLRGQSLNAVRRRAKERGVALPLGMTLSVLASAAEGLHAAHETRTQGGEPMHIVHRDVSPQNILIGYDGTVKVADFGIAAAAGRMTKTRSGHVKGKFHYMAPEQIRKQPVDRGADVWALGVVAWQLLAGTWLFKASDDAATLWNVLNLEVPHLGDRAPRKVANAIHAALDRNPYGRPESCRELAKVFRDGARDLGHDDDTERSAYMTDLFGSERAIENERLAAAMREEPAPPLHGDDMTRSTLELAVRTTVDPPSPEQPSRRGSARRLWAVVAVALLGGAAAAVGVAGWPFGDGSGSQPSSSDSVANAAPIAPDGEHDETATDGQPTADEPYDARAEPELTAVQVRVSDEATVVLVDGKRHVERPVRLELGPSQTATLEVFGPDGQVVTRTVGVEDDGARIGLASKRRRPRRRPRPTEPAEDEEPSGILRSEDVF